MENRYAAPFDDLAFGLSFGLGKAMRYAATRRALAGRSGSARDDALGRVAKALAEYVCLANWQVRPPGRTDLPRGLEPNDLAPHLLPALDSALGDARILADISGKDRQAKAAAIDRTGAILAAHLRASELSITRGPRTPPHST